MITLSTMASLSPSAMHAPGRLHEPLMRPAGRSAFLPGRRLRQQISTDVTAGRHMIHGSACSLCAVTPVLAFSKERCEENLGRERPHEGRDLVLQVLASGILAAGMALAGVEPAAAALAYSVPAPARMQPFALVAAADADMEAQQLTAPPPADDALERARQLKEVLAQRRREAMEQAAAARAEAEAAAAAVKAQRAAEEASRPTPPPPPSPSPSPLKAEAPKAAPSLSKAAASPAPAGPKRSHGYMPVFLAQFLVLAAFGGAIVAVAKLPDTTWKRAEVVVAAALPIVEQAWRAAEPVLVKGADVAKELAVEAQPYAVKAAQAAKPLALKAVDAAKPVLKQGQEKLGELFAQAQAKVKSS